MVCQNCGEEIEKGCLYCEKCGTEIHIVPDFNPIVENSISETLDTVARELQPAKQDLESVQQKIHKRKMIVVSSICFVLAVVCITLISVGICKDNSAKVHVKKAQSEYKKEHYTEAAQYYVNALAIDQKDSSIQLALADCYQKMGEEKKAEKEYLSIIEYDGGNESAYASVIAIYEKNGDYNVINNLLMRCSNDEIISEFQSYMAKKPEFNYKTGNYDTVIPLKLIAPSDGTLYYTIDGTIPGKGSLIYTAPIFLKKGDYTISAIYINDYGISSEVVKGYYHIQAQVPEDPVVSLMSGEYSVPQLIKVTVPQDCNVYYTTDGSAPDLNSSIYGEPIPIDMGVSTYKFVSISDEGVPGNVVQYTYHLNVATNYTKQDAINRVLYRLVEVNRLVDSTGAVANMNGKNIYVYNSLRYLDNKTFFFIYEYYQEGNSSRSMTGNVYAVDANDGRVYKAEKQEDGTYLVEPI